MNTKSLVKKSVWLMVLLCSLISLSSFAYPHYRGPYNHHGYYGPHHYRGFYSGHHRGHFGPRFHRAALRICHNGFCFFGR
jgi:hypothetical protein